MSDPFSDPHDASLPLSQQAAADPPYLSVLNDEQRRAVLAIDGPVLVLAGAGTGKTRVLTTRLAHILWTRRAYPGQVLAVTFTNKAAREMRDRVGELLGGIAESMQWLGTFHSICAKILRYHAELVGLKSNFTILDTDDQIRLLKQLIVARDLDEKRWPARVLAGQIDSWKNRGLLPDQVPQGEAYAYANGLGGELYAEYQDRLRTLNAADFGDLILGCITLFMNNPDVLTDFQRRFKYILVDEYQDTNTAQYLWLRLLAQRPAGEPQNICCVGDDDQSIYGWRGAEVGNILKFEEDFPGAMTVRLEQNYRSTPHILAAASGLIESNEHRLGKTLWTEIDDGEKISVRGVWDGEEEARQIGEMIEAYHRQNYNLNDMAILVRASFQTREFEERLLTLGVPYRVVGGPRFYERMEIRDALAYLRVTAQPDDDLAFERIVNKPKRGLGKASLQMIHDIARRDSLSQFRAARMLVETEELKPKARNSLRNLLDHFDRWRSMIDQTGQSDLAGQILDESGYTEMLQLDRSPEAPGRLENLKELLLAMEEFENLTGFLEHVSLVMENEQNPTEDMINIMTLHSAKGLEFKCVFLPGWEEGLFPHQRSLDDGGKSGLEEERRLAYVGITRAREHGTIFFAANRRIHGSWQSAIPSRFIDELPPAHVEVLADTGLYGGGSSFDDSVGFSNTYSTPGWRRMQGRFGDNAGGGFNRTTAPIDVQAELVTTSDPEVSSFAIGERVFHQKFGYGIIEDTEGNKLDINFDKAGNKKVIDRFVERA